MKIKDATFNTAVRLPNKKMENFVTDQYADLFYNTEHSLLYISIKDSGIVKLVGLTNIQEMTIEQKKEVKTKQ